MSQGQFGLSMVVLTLIDLEVGHLSSETTAFHKERSFFFVVCQEA